MKYELCDGFAKDGGKLSVIVGIVSVKIPVAVSVNTVSVRGNGKMRPGNGSDFVFVSEVDRFHLFFRDGGKGHAAENGQHHEQRKQNADGFSDK